MKVRGQGKFTWDVSCIYSIACHLQCQIKNQKKIPWYQVSRQTENIRSPQCLRARNGELKIKKTNSGFADLRNGGWRDLGSLESCYSSSFQIAAIFIFQIRKLQLCFIIIIICYYHLCNTFLKISENTFGGTLLYYTYSPYACAIAALPRDCFLTFSALKFLPICAMIL